MSFGLSAAAVGAIGVGAGVVGSALAADAATDSAEIQAGATRQANDLSMQQFQQMRSDLAPFRDFGRGGVTRLATLLGVAERPEFESAAARAEVERLALERALPRAIRQVAEGWGTDFDTASNRGDMLAEARRLASANDDDRRGAYDQVAAGWGAKPGAEFGSLLRNFTGEDLANEPGYQFGLSEGLKAGERSAAARGGLLSGAQLKAATRFGNDYASTKFGEAFNRDSANKTRMYNFLSGSVGTGQASAAQTGQAGANMAQQVGANTTALANATGAAGIAGANAWSQGLNNTAGQFQQNELISRVLGGNRGFSGGGATRGYTVPTYDGAEY